MFPRLGEGGMRWGRAGYAEPASLPHDTTAGPESGEFHQTTSKQDMSPRKVQPSVTPDKDSRLQLLSTKRRTPPVPQ